MFHPPWKGHLPLASWLRALSNTSSNVQVSWNREKIMVRSSELGCPLP